MDVLQDRLDELNGSLLEAMLLADAGVGRDDAIEAVRCCSARLEGMLSSAPESHGLLHHSYLARNLRRDCDAELACLTAKVRGTRGRFRHIISQMEALESCLAPSHRRAGEYSWPVAGTPLADAADAADAVSVAGIAAACRDAGHDVIGSETDPVVDEASPLAEAADPVPEDTNALAEATEPAPEPIDAVLEPAGPAPESVPLPADPAGAEELCDRGSSSSDADSIRSLDTETVNGDGFSTAPTSPTNSHRGVMEEGPASQSNKSEETLAQGKAHEGSSRRSSSAEHGRPRQLSLVSAPDSTFADKIFDDGEDENANDEDQDLDRVGDTGSACCSEQRSEHSEKAECGGGADAAPSAALEKKTSSAGASTEAAADGAGRTKAGAAVEAFDSLISRTKKALASPKAKEESAPPERERPKSFRGMARKFMHLGKARDGQL